MAAVGWPAAAYVLSTIVAALLTKHMQPGWPRMLAAALPLPAIMWLAHAELMRLRRCDELRQRIELEAMTIAFALSFCLILMLALLDLFGAIHVTIFAAAMLMTLCLLGAHWWVRARYRYGCPPRDGENAP
ncbi:hypothetical protein [Dokdonella soli]|uniref:hypothetical protein n=1 Tax=Dokdonella soli TaxID=529810 RepID=UPI0031DF2F78